MAVFCLQSLYTCTCILVWLFSLPQDVVVRVSFVLGNMTAKNEIARLRLFQEAGSFDILLSLFRFYLEQDVKVRFDSLFVYVTFYVKGGLNFMLLLSWTLLSCASLNSLFIWCIFLLVAFHRTFLLHYFCCPFLILFDSELFQDYNYIRRVW